MASKEKKGSVKRFGARYGRKIRHKIAKIENLTQAKYNCPHCGQKAVKRVSAGIWQCKKCEVKFAGKAYVPNAKAANM